MYAKKRFYTLDRPRHRYRERHMVFATCFAFFQGLTLCFWASVSFCKRWVLRFVLQPLLSKPFLSSVKWEFTMNLAGFSRRWHELTFLKCLAEEMTYNRDSINGVCSCADGFHHTVLTMPFVLCGWLCFRKGIYNSEFEKSPNCKCISPAFQKI